MPTHADLIRDYIRKEGKHHKNANLYHATLASSPERTEGLKRAVISLLTQVDTLHVYLNNFEDIPAFLDNEKIYITRSRDFGNLGECGKYYWVEDLQGYHFICSDRFIYPNNYVEKLRKKIDFYEKKVVLGCGAYLINQSFVTFDESATHLPETESRESDTEVELLKDSSLAFHSDTIKVSRHHFYQPQLSSLWFSLMAKEKSVPMICVANIGTSLKPPFNFPEPLSDACDPDNYRTFFIKTYIARALIRPEKNDMNSWFDKIYVMNLDRRKDRWAIVNSRIQKQNILICRFPAVDGYAEPFKSQFEEYIASGQLKLPEAIEPLETFRQKYLDYRHYIARIQFMERKLGRRAIQSPGALGYALSYISILTEAIAREFERIMIFDDDIILHKEFNNEFQKRMDNLPTDWMLIMLGAMQHHWEPPWISWENEMMYHCNGTSIASHAVGLDSRAFLPVLYYSQKLDLPIDEGAIYHLQHVYADQCFVFYPNLAIQDIGESEINSSAISQEDILKKNNLFRWDYDEYDLLK